MTKVRFFVRGGLLCGFEAKGHSGYAEAGADIVCAAVTTVVAMTETYLTDICGYKTSVVQDDEQALISVEANCETDAEKQNCHMILQAAKATLEENAREYSSWLRVSVVKRDCGKKIL